jgi:TPR repeat protein
VDKDTTQSLLWYTKAADAGHPDALNNLGIKYRRGRWVKKDYNKAMQLFKKSANAGNAYGMFNLGRMYEFGNGTKQDYKKAHEWYLKSVTVKPETGAAYRLGVFYEEGKGVQQDFTEAIRWYKTNIREPYSLHRLGNMYELGKGVTADKTEAVKWYNKAVEANSPFGMYYLGRFYEGENKLTIANDWYSKAYSLLISEIIKSIDNTEAMMVLAVMIETGKGTGKNIQQALSLYKHAAELGDEDAKVRVKQLEQ